MFRLIDGILHRRELRKIAQEQELIRQACPHKFVEVGERYETTMAGSYITSYNSTILYCVGCGIERSFRYPADARRELAKQKAREEAEAHL